jgi:hypothetical protein
MIAREEHVLPDREDHIDRWRTLVPVIPEQFQHGSLPSSPAPRGGWN